MAREGHTDRTGLYVMVFFCLLNSCSADSTSRDALNVVKQIQKDGVLIKQTPAQQDDDR